MPERDEQHLFLTEELRSERNQALFRLTIGLLLLVLAGVGELVGLRAEMKISMGLFLILGSGFLALACAGLVMLWLIHPSRYRSWYKYVGATLDQLIICVMGLGVSYISPQFLGASIPAFKTPAWYLLLLTALGPAFRFSPAFAVSNAVGTQAAMLIWLLQAHFVLQIDWTADPRADLFGDQTSWLVTVVRFVITGLICRSGWLIARNSRRVVTTAVETQVGLAQEQFRRQQIQLNMQRYFLPHVAESLAEGSGLPGLGGERRRLVILMSDIRNFTTTSEGVDPGQVVAELNRYFTAMVDVLFQTRGTLLGFIGDGILAVYGLPDSSEDDAHRALDGARTMLARLGDLKAGGEFPGLGDFRIGIGLHIGEVMVGNIGALQRMEYTVIGDAVNTTARVEALNKPLCTEILMTADLVAALDEHTYHLRSLGEHQVKGKAQMLTVFTLEGL